MKKLALVLTALVLSLTASAQFEQGKVHAAASLSGVNLSYNGAEKWNVGLDALAGYFIEDNWMVYAKAGIDRQSNDTGTSVDLGAGGRYYIIQNGLYLGANCSYKHMYHNYNDIVPGIELGYAFFINRHCTIEPALYYNQSLKDHANYSTFGVRIGFGIYM